MSGLREVSWILTCDVLSVAMVDVVAVCVAMIVVLWCLTCSDKKKVPDM